MKILDEALVLIFGMRRKIFARRGLFRLKAVGRGGRLGEGEGKGEGRTGGGGGGREFN